MNNIADGLEDNALTEEIGKQRTSLAANRRYIQVVYISNKRQSSK